MQEKGISLIALTITAIVLIILAGAIAVGSDILKKSFVQSLATDMLLIQTKVKIINERVKFNGDTSILIGEKLKDNPNKENIAGNALTSAEMESDSLYIYDRETLDSIGLEGIKLDNGEVYIVDYDTGEIIWPDGVSNEEGVRLYKLSEIIEGSLINE